MDNLHPSLKCVDRRYRIALFGMICLWATSGCWAPLRSYGIPASELPDSFRIPTRSNSFRLNLAKLTLRQPVDYVLGQNDVLEVAVPGLHDDQLVRPFRVQVAPSGTIQLPLVGSVHVSGMNLDEAQRAINTVYSDGFLADPHVIVTLTDKGTVDVLVLGEVVKSGIYTLPRFQNDIGHAIAASGGLGENAADMIEVHRYVRRPSQSPQPNKQLTQPHSGQGNNRTSQGQNSWEGSQVSQRTQREISPQWNIAHRFAQTPNDQKPKESPTRDIIVPPPWNPGHSSLQTSARLVQWDQGLESRVTQAPADGSYDVYVQAPAYTHAPVRSPNPSAAANPLPTPFTFPELGHSQAYHMGESNRFRGDMTTCIKIPLSGPFMHDVDPEEVRLQDGDVVSVPRRRAEVFYVVGKLSRTNTVNFSVKDRDRELGNAFLLPRDRDIDVMTAVTMAGYLDPIDSPTTVTVHRILPDGRPLLVRVDLIAARSDPLETILVQPGDIIYLNPDAPWWFRRTIDRSLATLFRIGTN